MAQYNRNKFALDVFAFLALLVVMDPRASGVALHERLSLALAGTIVVHLLLNWDWIVCSTARLIATRGKGGNDSRLNYALNWLLFIDGVLITLSGIMISQSVAPALGFVLPPNAAWRGLHEFSANMALVLMGLHLALHWRWIVSTFKKLWAARKTTSAVSLNGKDTRA